MKDIYPKRLIEVDLQTKKISDHMQFENSVTFQRFIEVEHCHVGADKIIEVTNE